MKKLLGIMSLIAATATVGCASTDGTASEPRHLGSKSTVNMPLLTTVDGETWRVQGDVTVLRVNEDGTTIEGEEAFEVPGFSASLAEVATVEVEPGFYAIHMENWTLSNQDGTEVCTDSGAEDNICLLIQDDLFVEVVSNETAAVTFEFIINGEPAGVPTPTPDAGVDVCSGGGCYCPNGNCCTADADHDGFMNCVECPSAVFLSDATACPDTDQDGTPDYLDENSDCDLIDDCDEGTVVELASGTQFVLSNTLRVDNLTCLAPDTGEIDIDVDIIVEGEL